MLNFELHVSNIDSKKEINEYSRVSAVTLFYN